MPIYRYRCEACGTTSEVFARMSDPPPDTCPECGGGPMRKAVARTSFQLKGGGWYAQGYAGGSGGSTGGGDSGGSTGGGDSGGDSGGSDSGGGSPGGGDSGGASAGDP